MVIKLNCTAGTQTDQQISEDYLDYLSKVSHLDSYNGILRPVSAWSC